MIVEEKSEETIEQNAGPAKAPAQPPALPLRGLLLLALLAVLVGAYVIYTGLTSRARASSSLERATLANSIQTVTTIHPQNAAGAEEIELPGNMQPFVDTPIWARSSGYLKQWYADIGAHVKRGQLLAEIEAPELDQQLQQARAQLSTDQANLKLAQITAERYSHLFTTDSVSKQDVDNAVQAAAARTAEVTSAQANVSRLEQLVAYEKVYAPFDGVITVRNVDVGALVNADANTAGKELFHLASNTTLRVYVNVPEIYSHAAKPGVTANLSLSEFPGRQFHGVVVRNAKAIDINSRTLLVEVDVRNPTGELLPGSYASVHLKLPSKTEAVTVPTNTLLFRSEGLRVALVRKGRVELAPVTLGRDYGDKVEVVYGLDPQDAVIVNPNDSIVSGEQVRTANSGAQAE
jgi:RND family efflux transporter MFP subunit